MASQRDTNDAPNAGEPPTEYFTGLAERYAAHRPSYPDAAVDRILADLAATPQRPARIADVGCGTGILSRLMSARGATVVGVDPNLDMLKAARTVDPDATFHQAPAEATGLDDEAFDAVTCAQSFHWFDAAAALAEFARILRSGGQLFTLWNVRDHSDPAGEVYDRIMRKAQTTMRNAGRAVPENRSGDVTLGGLFTITEQVAFPNPQRFTRTGLVGRADSASYFPREGRQAGRAAAQTAARRT